MISQKYRRKSSTKVLPHVIPFLSVIPDLIGNPDTIFSYSLSGLSGQARPHGHGASVMTGGGMSFPFYLSFPRRREPRHHILPFSFWFIGSSPTPWIWGKCNDRGRDVIPFLSVIPAKAGTQTPYSPILFLGYRVKPDPMDMGQV
jgi:hypothetical protein